MKLRWIMVALLSAGMLPAVATALHPSAVFAAVSSAATPQYDEHDHDRDRGERDRDHDRDHDRDRDHDWDRDPRFEGRSPAYRRGFRAGFEDARGDQESGQRQHYGPRFRHPKGDYREEFGAWRDFVHEFRGGYQDGYREGYERRR